MSWLSGASGSAHLELHVSDDGIPWTVYTVSARPQARELFTDILCASLYATRQLVNLGQGNATATAVAHDLRAWYTHWDLQRLLEAAAPEYEGLRKAKRQFVADLTFNYDTGKVQFTMHPKGFGMLSRDVERFVQPSVTELVLFLARKYQRDTAALVQLSEALELVARMFIDHTISVKDQQSVAAWATLMATDSDNTLEHPSTTEFGQYVREVLEVFAAVVPAVPNNAPDARYAEEEFERIRGVMSNTAYRRINAMRPAPPFVAIQRSLLPLVNAVIGAVGDALGVVAETRQGSEPRARQNHRHHRDVAMPELTRRWREFRADLRDLRQQHSREYQELNIPTSVLDDVDAMVNGVWSEPLLTYCA